MIKDTNIKDLYAKAKRPLITMQDFEKYLKVQHSGVTNMFDVRMVEQLSGLTREQILDIMQNYQKYENLFVMETL